MAALLCRCWWVARPVQGSRGLVTTPPRLNPLAPTYSSTGDTDKLVTSLGPVKVCTMVGTGLPNWPLPPSHQLDLSSFLPSAVSAASMVTRAAASQDWAGLEGLVERQCLDGLANNVATMEPQQRELVALNSDDVFFTFLANPGSCEKGNDLNVVTFSLPQLGQVKEIVRQNKLLQAEFQESMKEVSKDKNLEAVKETVEEFNNRLQENNPHSLFKENEIVIGNYRFRREDVDTDWVISEVGQINSLEAWPTVFKWRWKGRLGIATRGEVDFYKVLRVDYLTDYLMLLAIALLPGGGLGMLESKFS